MPIKNILITDATPDQRRSFATDFLNLDVTPEDDDNAVQSKIEQAQPGTKMIFIEEAEAPIEPELRPEETSGRSTGTLGKGDPRAVIHIDSVESEDGSGGRDVLVGVNGRAWQLKRGANLDVPWRVVEALHNAQADIIRHEDGETTSRKSRRVPVNVISGPSKEEIEAWRERTAKDFCA